MRYNTILIQKRFAFYVTGIEDAIVLYSSNNNDWYNPAPKKIWQKAR